jgi:hypothetical protein
MGIARRWNAMSLAIAAGIASGGSVVAQQTPAGGEPSVPLLVTAASDRSVYLDHGRDVGLQVGTFVRLFPPGSGEVEVQVRAVSQTSARADLPPEVPLPPIGTRGEARVVPPAANAPAPTPPPPRPEVPAHPPWTRREAARTDDQPLLVPTFGQRPDQRPTSLDGRWFLSSQWNLDRADQRDSQYWLLRSGVRADATNYLGTGERIRFAGEFDDRRQDADDRPASDDQNGRIDLASVAFGTEAYTPTGAEFGRFFSPHLPEIGLVDGAEFVRRFEGGVRIGAGFGAYPRPFPARDAGDDYGVHAFVDYTADAARTFAAALGVQKTWHLGAPDRDLLLLRGEWRPHRKLWLQGNGKVDFYTGSDDIKGRGLELTELMLQSRWDGGDWTTGVLASRFTWPELKRSEYQDLPPELVRDGFVDRLGWNASLRLAEPVSLRVRADLWRDQDRDGRTLGLDADWRSVWSQSSALSLATFWNDGGYSGGPGLRLTARDRIGALLWRASYRWYHYELSALVSGPESYTRQSAEIGISMPIGRSGDLDLSCERWFGEREDAFAIGLYVQWRF